LQNNNNVNRNQKRIFLNYFYSHRVSWKLVKRAVAGPILLKLVLQYNQEIYNQEYSVEWAWNRKCKNLRLVIVAKTTE
jgi:hypothetical protein